MQINTLKNIIILLLSILLQGCVTIIASNAAVATKSINDPRTISMQIKDNLLQRSITNTISQDHAIKNQAHIIVIVYNGKILLIGQAPTQKLVHRAIYRVMTIVKNTRKIYNGIRVNHQKISIPISLSDTLITTQICLYIFNSNQVKLSNIKVITENGEVFLLGLVTQQEAAAAANIASRVKNVRHVITVFTILK
ncbi:division/outer membrane stress-associated lipid-binding lipoprotein [Pantoea sp. Aalb]|uniref:division/outer membrane stress-associated lipid-binding lipoprotein n=1 Tax=Pantoea sp. Aalb TaxID=2576762 RepID=UPI001328A5AE|nr:division/outer membrane stress-associated lipid-binding lipoprotein [Pantoea sp. Aalb]MXP67693.1 divisome-associated lipoprotein YraP [Pantoea sp. Aalb]